MRGRVNTGMASSKPIDGPSRRHPYSAISFEKQKASDRGVARNDKGGLQCASSSSASTAPHVSLLMQSDEKDAVLDTGATANLACFKWLQRHNTLLVKNGTPAAAYPNAASSKFGTT